MTAVYSSVILSALLFCLFQRSALEFIDEEQDWLVPYKYHHGPRHSHRHVRSCQPARFGNTTHETVPGDTSDTAPAVTTRHFIEGAASRAVFGHLSVVSNPLKNVVVLEPGKKAGCDPQRPLLATVQDTGIPENCLVGVNAGFFNTTSHECLGNVISDGRLALNSGGLQNVNFGIKKDGSLFFGYVSENEVKSGDFQQLVAGVIWVIRDGKVFINESKTMECSDSQETGTLDKFINVLSARTAVGHDNKGRLVFVQVEGRTLQRGMTLWEFADLLIKYGVVNAINLDGGGSATYVANNTLVNYPSDVCGNFRCARKVSTIICARDPDPKAVCPSAATRNYGISIITLSMALSMAAITLPQSA